MKLPITLFVAVWLFSLLNITVFAQSSDNGNGTFTNPVIWGDFPDPDVIRVGNTYYMISTSMHYFPGVTLMESPDLVNWSIASNVVEEFKEHPFYDLDGGNRYAKGQWATSLRYFNNQFYVLFTTLTEGSYIYTSSEARGAWTKHKLDAFLYDPGMFIDTDGRVYVVHGNTEIQLTELHSDGLSVKTPAKPIYTAHRQGLEGNRCYKIGDYYYIYCTYGGPQGNQVCLRSKSLAGPFEERVVMNYTANYSPLVLHQGALIDLPDGSYWCMIFQDHDGLGRIPYLIPVYWLDNWPVLGNPMDGNMTLQKPIKSTEVVHFPTTDEFNDSQLALQWQFNHNPDKSKYSLNENKGSLRLYTATLTDSLLKARNTICQRIIGPHSEGTLKMDVSKMKVGDKSGLVLLQDPFATLTVNKINKGYELLMTVNEEVKSRIDFKESIIYLRADVNGMSNNVDFSYSLDNKTFQPIGDKFKMQFKLSIFCGNRYGIFNYATAKMGGYIDVDWFRVKHTPLFSRDCNNGTILQAEYFDHHYASQTRLSANDKENRNQDVVFQDGGLIAFSSLNIKENNLNRIELTVECNSTEASLEIYNHDKGKIIGKTKISDKAGYQTVIVDLDTPLESVDRLEFRVWNYGNKGIVALDKIRFSSVLP
ncbi:beta-xylosidase [Dysgonomonas sp. 521]|uniref:glycoside hydrolase family 43 protein n=1 Tax=Dysgonomonas sp. 521 TaxID=2302932 RepID=UPI0013D2DFDF|nr:glycoside hydrolase 43 family protein [Dysgonomonas sp. 521]NDV95141.1 beta-xylosidase [Dysgonomonas sp. 521]